MGVKTKIAAVAVLMLVAGLAFWPRDPEVVDPILPKLVQTTEGSTASYSGALSSVSADAATPSSPSDEREALVSPTETLESTTVEGTTGQHEYHLEVVVVDHFDRPRARADVYACPVDGPWNLAGRTDEDGRLHVRWLGRQPTMSLGVGARAGGATGEAWRLIDMRAGITHHVRIGVRNKTQSLVLHSRTRLALQLEAGASAEPGTFWLDASVVYPSSAPNAADMLGLEDGRRAFVAPVGNPPGEMWNLGGTPTSLVLPGMNLRSGSTETFTIVRYAQPETPTTEPAPGQARLVGVVLGPDGEPVSGALVIMGHAHGPYQHETNTNERGEFVLDGLSPGAWRVRAGGGNHGQHIAYLEASPGQEITWEARLDRGHELAGRIFDTETQGERKLDDWLVCAISEDPDDPWFDSCVTDEKGCFAIPNLPLRPLRVFLHGPSAWDKPPYLIEEAVLPGRAPLELAIADVDLPRAALQLLLSGEEGEPVSIPTARVWHAESGRGYELELLEDHMTFRGENLPHGSYTLVAGGHGQTWLEVHRFHLAPGEYLDLGPVILPARGSLQAIEAGSAPEGERARRITGRLCRVDDQLVSHVVELDKALPLDLPLPEGRYELSVTAGDETRVHAFDVASGLPVQVQVRGTAAPVEATSVPTDVLPDASVRVGRPSQD